MYGTALFKRVEHVTKEWVKSVSMTTSRKKKKCSNDLLELVIKHFLDDDSKPEIAKKLLIPWDSVHYIMAKYKPTNCIRNLMDRGRRRRRRRKTSTHIDHILQWKAKINHRKLAASVKCEFENELKVIISESTVCRLLHEVGLYEYVSRKIPYVNQINWRKDLEYAKNYREKPLDFWKNVLQSSKSKFKFFESDRKVIVWRSPKKEFGPECIVPTIKHGGDNINCWACFSSSDLDRLIFIDGNMTSESYREILENYLLKSVEKLGMSHDWIL